MQARTNTGPASDSYSLYFSCSTGVSLLSRPTLHSQRVGFIGRIHNRVEGRVNYRTHGKVQSREDEPTASWLEPV